MVHHLDRDETNDDPSNLVLMGKPQHTAHHWKNKTINVPITIDNANRSSYAPRRKPRYYFNKKAKRYFLQFSETDENGGKPRLIQLWKYNDKPILKEEDAIAFCNELWNDGVSMG